MKWCLKYICSKKYKLEIVCIKICSHWRDERIPFDMFLSKAYLYYNIFIFLVWCIKLKLKNILFKKCFLWEIVLRMYLEWSFTILYFFKPVTLKKSSFPILRELNGIFYLELIKVNKPSQIIKTIKQKVFHFERPLERFGSHRKKNPWHLTCVPKISK